MFRLNVVESVKYVGPLLGGLNCYVLIFKKIYRPRAYFGDNNIVLDASAGVPVLASMLFKLYLLYHYFDILIKNIIFSFRFAVFRLQGSVRERGRNAILGYVRTIFCVSSHLRFSCVRET